MPNIVPEPKDIVCVILVGRASDQAKAERMTRASKSCPYVALYTSKDDMICGVFTLPRDREAWIEYPKEKPKFLDLEQVLMTVVTDQLEACSGYTRGEMFAEEELAPCGKHCNSGCPSTIFYYASE